MSIVGALFASITWNNVTFKHTAFECASATLSGIEKVYNKIKKDGKTY